MKNIKNNKAGISLLTKIFINSTVANVRKNLSKEFGGKELEKIMSNAKSEYKKIAWELPYIGSNSRPLSMILVWSAWTLGLYLVLKKLNKSAEWIGGIILKANKLQVDSTPKFVKRGMNKKMFSSVNKGRMKDWCLKSGLKEYPEGWSADFVESIDGEFDYGIDYKECGICKLYSKYNAMDVVPFICKTDFNLAGALGHKLVRTMTIAEGAEKCDFRYKKI